ncbi:MAG: acyl-CoA thioesterase [Pikeienuella sp.]
MTVIHPLDQETALSLLKEGVWAGASTKAYGNMVGTFGGVVAATLLNAVVSDERRMGEPVSLTVNFCASVVVGDLTVQTKLQRAGKYTQHWSLELTQNDQICATASVVTGTRGDVFAMQSAGAPDVPKFEDCTPIPEYPVKWMGRYDMRFVEGQPEFASKQHDPLGSPYAAVWLRDNPDRTLDAVALASLADCFFPRLLHIRGTVVPFATVSMTTHFLATPEDLAEQADRPVLGVVDGDRFQGNFHNQRMQLWSESGKMLAVGTQVVWYKH